MDHFVGTWALTDSDNDDEYMKAVGVSLAIRQLDNMAKPNLVISVDDDGLISIKSETTFKTTEIKFKLNKKIHETTSDGRSTKSTFTLENGKLVQQQTWDGKKTTLEREIKDGIMTIKCVMDDVVSMRTYEKRT